MESVRNPAQTNESLKLLLNTTHENRKISNEQQFVGQKHRNIDTNNQTTQRNIEHEALNNTSVQRPTWFPFMTTLYLIPDVTSNCVRILWLCHCRKFKPFQTSMNKTMILTDAAAAPVQTKAKQERLQPWFSTLGLHPHVDSPGI